MPELQGQEMQVAQILSDLVSLSPGVCDPAAAQALVSARSALPSSSTPPEQDEKDPDLRRVKELVSLHYDVRERCKSGEISRGLAEARSMVERAMAG